MERYKILTELGDGTSGIVYKAIYMETSKIVAVKKMKRKFNYWEECVNLREVKSLRKLNHPNIIKLLEVVQENNELFFIFEYMEHNLYEIMKDQRKSLREDEIRGLMAQLLQGLAHVHKHGYVHRDLKPENLLVTNNIIKIADFGLARELSSSPPFTDYVSTRWYRAPEVLLQSSSYTPAIDMWAVGAILSELFTLHPIFPGESEIDQLYKICCVLGAPDWRAFPQATNISRLVDISYSEVMPTDFSDIVPNASLEAIDLIKKLCSWDPLRRPTADQCLEHPFFHVTMQIPRAPVDALKLNLGPEPNLELNLWNFGAAADDCFLGLTLAVNPSAANLEKVKKSQDIEEDLMFCSSFQDHSQQSVLWSLFPSDHSFIPPSVPSSLSLSFSFTPINRGFTIRRFCQETFSAKYLGSSLTSYMLPFPARWLPLKFL
ncbi:serine/threonine-protein kinase MHK-like isoform X1 [Salvia splendens]|uniref:serine/threonine-protein kinase MHK-like isoform X1 n=1 Tax=Salvia splendens TaxID=180675 RepID=UPI001C25F0E7|nr:serine/threonine-protein kinase MHK-like isoform X1 [Salvia splendens]XP_041997964.1 serine/threonine-protein kinase MHK-like isoform X1 [Salvia splendens]XP_041997965.1 serine/threonine-protein kinase MHK-like isoform X1 [Salvia splendens]XP_041997966.1 serine/threonine-protein kinase MHK-like isoform X1 [Salvia splendens]